MLPNSFYEAKIILILKKKKKKIQVNIIDEHRYKNPHQNTSKPYLTIHFKDHTP